MGIRDVNIQNVGNALRALGFGPSPKNPQYNHDTPSLDYWFTGLGVSTVVLGPNPDPALVQIKNHGNILKGNFSIRVNDHGGPKQWVGVIRGENSLALQHEIETCVKKYMKDKQLDITFVPPLNGGA